MSERTDEQVIHEVLTAERTLVAARFALSTGRLENSAEVKNIRRGIARLKTEARRREIDQGLEKDSLLNKYRPSFSSGATVDVVEEEPEKGGFLKGIVDKLSGTE